MKNRTEKEALLELLRLCYGSVNEKRLKVLLSRCDMEVLKALTARSGIAGFIYSACRKKAYISDQFLSFLLPLSGAAALKNSLLKQDLLEIADTFSKNKIDYFVVKGISMVQRIYGDLSCRAVTDIDIMVKKVQYQRASYLLEELDYHYPQVEMQRVSDVYSKEWVERQMREILYVKDALPFDVLVDLHQEMNLFRDNAVMNSLYPLDEHDWFDNVVLYETEGQSIACLNSEFMLLHLIYHFTIEHSFMGLKWLADICQILRTEKLDWDKIDRAVENPNLRRLVSLCLGLAAKIIGEEFLTEKVRKSFFEKNQGSYRLYKSMLFEDGCGMRAKVYNKFLKVTFPAAPKDRRAVLRYYLFDKNSIDHRTSGHEDSTFMLLQPFVLLKIMLADLKKKRKNKKNAK